MTFNVKITPKYSLYIVDLSVEYAVKSKAGNMVQKSELNLLPLVLDENNLNLIHRKTMKSIVRHLAKIKRVDQSTIVVKKVLLLKTVFSSHLKYNYDEEF